MRITKISVKGLFGMFDHEIPLNQESRITIVHGPNGVGKTVLLQLVHGLFNYDYEFLAETPFDQLHIEFSDNEFIAVNKSEKGNGDDNAATFEITYETGTGRTNTPFRPSILSEKNLAELVKELLPDSDHVIMPYERIRSYWVVSRDIGYEVLTREDILREHPALQTKLYGDPPSWFAHILHRVDPSFISTFRLKSEKMNMEIFRGIHQSKGDVKVFPSPDKAVRVIGDYFGILGRDLISAKATHTEDLKKIDGLSAKIDKLNMKIAELEDNLALDEIANNPRISSVLRKHLADFINDRKILNQDLEKLTASRDFVLACDLFADIINERILFKALKLENVGIHVEEYEFMFISENGSEVPVTALSSGEQQLLILYDKLLFETYPDTLVMIDEPELSMNVVWQRNFLKDLQRIIELRKFDVLIATHSPQIIHDKWDWMVPLGERVDD